MFILVSTYDLIKAKNEKRINEIMVMMVDKDDKISDYHDMVDGEITEIRKKMRREKMVDDLVDEMISQTLRESGEKKIERDLMIDGG